MDARSNFGAAKILCVERDSAVLESRCAVLKYSGYDTVSASPQGAEVVLSSRKFDLIVLSRLSEFEQHGILNLADGAEVLVLEGLTMPKALLALIEEKLNGSQRRA
jgi:CheY-like chemotaxis protein